MVDQLNAAIETQSIRLGYLESRLDIAGADYVGIVDRINYHMGVQSGLRQALFMVQAEEL